MKKVTQINKSLLRYAHCRESVCSDMPYLFTLFWKYAIPSYNAENEKKHLKNRWKFYSSFFHVAN